MTRKCHEAEAQYRREIHYSIAQFNGPQNRTILHESKFVVSSNKIELFEKSKDSSI